MAITLEQINPVLEARGLPTATAHQLAAAQDYALGYYSIPYSVLNADEPAERLILGIALLSAQAPFTHAATAPLTSSEIKSASGASVKKDFADAPTDPYPVISGILAPYSANTRPSGISFGISTR
ncbi:hypothetical protein [Sphingobium limneticum]|uniref:Uncharacterized protein n=1 Tax=Sphingobium limneticum TaxID=1007511 RepID=A0A5J5I3N3_9SPHN|nr:hypothetical protein [Sphingobium limneticum]KAA9018296.1 hypothetical protein F4U96_09295 [Sphingobium limneticum]KAA9030932.1 hypothetical protein F4U95_09245 [Sphingobium limneticum]